jgi:hypothetical protein
MMNCEECGREAEVEIAVRRFVLFDERDPVHEYGFCSEHWPDTDDEVRDLKARIKRGDYLEVEGVRDSMDVLRELVSERPAMYVGNFEELQAGYDLTDEQVDELRATATGLLGGDDE